MSERKDKKRIFLWPIVVAAATVIGLISALFGDGFWDVLSWMSLALPAAFAARGLSHLRR